MVLDFDYLFTPENIVVVKNIKTNEVYAHTVLEKELKECYKNKGDFYFEEDDYKNPQMKYNIFQILTIYTIDSEGNIKTKIFDYLNLTPPFPHLETGMFVQNKYGNIGVVAGDYIYYYNAGWDCTKDIQRKNDKDNYIIAVYNGGETNFSNIKTSIPMWVSESSPCRYYECNGRCNGQKNTPECFCGGHKEKCPKYSWEELTK